MKQGKPGVYARYIKRILDVLLSGCALVVLSPMLLIVAVLVRTKLGSPVIFCQERPGKDEKIFKMYKFRSMTDARDENGELLPDEVRLTKFGRALRSTSLDELPELWCIFTGKMSFVGPRPLPTYYGPYFLPEERKRHTVRGGLIPPDSLSGKTYTTYEEQFAYECYYAEHLSFLLDIKVIYTTFRILWGRVTTGYGAQMDRPHLNVYRKDMDKKE